METKKENKKGFWASLFSKKTSACACNDHRMITEAEKPTASCRCEDMSATPQAATSSQTPETSQTPQTPQAAVKEIKILGPGCAKCISTYQAVEKVVHEHRLDVKLTKVEDIVEIMGYNIMTTPAVVVDGTVKIKGHVPSESEIKQMLGI